MVNQLISAAIIDDEMQARSALKESLSIHCPEIKVLYEASSVSEGKKLFEQETFQLLFLDIQLTDGLGFEILESFKHKKQKVIFTTAYSQYALKAIKFSALDYLLKPISGRELKEAVAKVLELESDLNHLLISNFLKNQETSTLNKRIALHSSEGITLCDINSIIRCQSEGNYVRFYFTDRKPLMIAKTLKDTEEMLMGFSFERIHHSHIVNINHMLSYVSKDGGYVLMKDDSMLPVSNRKRSHLLERLSKFDLKFSAT